MQRLTHLLLSSLSGLTIFVLPAGVPKPQPPATGAGALLQIRVCVPGDGQPNCGPQRRLGIANNQATAVEKWNDDQTSHAGHVTIKSLKLQCPPPPGATGGCTKDVAVGANLNIVAVANSGYDGYAFKEWQGACIGKAKKNDPTTCVLKIDGSTDKVRVAVLFIAQ
jgi:hypothetical protein